MERIKRLNGYQRGVLVVVAVLVLVFTVVYQVTISRVGFSYRDAILVPGQEGDSTVYTGKLKGTPAKFTVSPDKTVDFQYGDKTFGPYTVREDPTAVPQDQDLTPYLTGIELYEGEKLLFRGGMWTDGTYTWLCNADGTLQAAEVYFTGGGVITDENGEVLDQMEPSPTVIVNLMTGPELTHKGDWTFWIYGVLVCAVTVVSVLFADELFRLNLAFQIRNVDRAEPSDWEIAGRYFGWTVLPILALVLFIQGLQ